MKICLSGRIVETLETRPDTDEFLRFAAGTGYDGVSLRNWQIPRTEKDARKLRDQLDALGLTISSCNIGGPEDIDFAVAAGVGAVQAANVEELCRRLPDGMRIGPQMHTGGTYETISSATEALRGMPVCAGVFVEPGNHILAGEKFSEDMFLPLRGRIAGCNLQSIEAGHGESSIQLKSGARVRFTRVPLAENGQIDMNVFLRALRNAGYDDFVNVIEPATDFACAEQSAIAVRGTLKAALEKTSAG